MEKLPRMFLFVSSIANNKHVQWITFNSMYVCMCCVNVDMHIYDKTSHSDLLVSVKCIYIKKFRKASLMPHRYHSIKTITITV